MEFVIIVILVIIILTLLSQRKDDEERSAISRSFTDTSAAFTEEEWNKACNDWYDLEQDKWWNYDPRGVFYPYHRQNMKK